MGTSQDDLDFFYENGFLGPLKLYEPDEAKALLHEIRNANVDRSKAIFDNDVNYDRHFDIPPLARHIGHPVIVEKLRLLLGGDILCWRTEFFPKFAGAAGTEWHQVHVYRYAAGTPFLEPTEDRGQAPIDLTVWTAFTDTTRETACMKFLPGSHKRVYYDESKQPKTGRDTSYTSVVSGTQFFGYNFEDFKVDPEWIPDESQAVAMEMKAGECVIFTARCVHASYPNTTRRQTRFAITVRYVPTHVRVYPDLQRFHAHGGFFDLKDYGCVLVSGTDRYGHNRIRRADSHGVVFPYVG